LPGASAGFSLRSLRLCGKGVSQTVSGLIKHARYNWLLLAEGHLHWRLFGQMLRLMDALSVPNG
jgi:hypothetical protein